MNRLKSGTQNTCVPLFAMCQLKLDAILSIGTFDSLPR